MIRRPSTPRNQKSLRSRRSAKDSSSRVGPEYQVDIPDYIGPVQPCSVSVSDMRDIKLWSPKQQPSNNIYEEYIKFAKHCGYPTDTAMTFLHWHGYNVAKARDDMSNYVPVKPNWTKSEVLRFLKCIDSKPRKNFVEAKKGVPGRLTGEISQLYYSIAAPFKASTRKKHHGALVNKCFSRAVQNGLIVSRWTIPLAENGQNRARRLGENKDALENEVELHLVNLIGIKKTERLLGHRMLSLPYPFLPTDNFADAPNDCVSTAQTSRIPRSNGVVQNGDTATNGSSVNPIITSTIYQTSSSGASSQVDAEFSCQPHLQAHCLPLGVHYDHSEFIAFASESEAEGAAQSEAELKLNHNLDTELVKLVISAENRACSVLHEIEMLKPVGGFPEVSYRWSKSELALVLHAMSVYGDDFAKIARIIGSKSESFLRNFYNQFRDRFPLNEIIRIAVQYRITPAAKTTSLNPAHIYRHGTKPIELVVDQVENPKALDATLLSTDLAASSEKLQESTVKVVEIEGTAATVNCVDHTLNRMDTNAVSRCSTPISLPHQSNSCLDGNGVTGKTTILTNSQPATETGNKASSRLALKRAHEPSPPNSQPRRGRRISSRLTESTFNVSINSDNSTVTPAEKVVVSRRGAGSFRRGRRGSGNSRISRATSRDTPRLQIGIVPGPGRRGRGRRRRM